ncbi:SGNH/GDSL hydrolase family protein [Rhodotorula paludigena]|uniref:SGNH/GDSL hydrolase family protein n=1 Tax=Rhodotorula paludigena TaxID=86838 RepID=UPI0031828DA5
MAHPAAGPPRNPATEAYEPLHDPLTVRRSPRGLHHRLRPGRFVAVSVFLLAALLGLAELHTHKLSTVSDFFPSLPSWSSPTSEPLARNLQLLQTQLAQPLRRGEAVRIGIIGGSISQQGGNYGTHIIPWLNRNWPPAEGEHEVFNMAIAASESSVSSVCLDVIFAPHARPGRPPIDLLLVEYAYNDNSLPDENDDKTTSLRFTRHANYERIIRRALEWPVPVIVIEAAALQIRKENQTSAFWRSSGYDHAQVAQYYSVPIVDWARFLYTFPDIDQIADIFRDGGLHPNPIGHNYLGGLILREILFHMQLSDNDTALFSVPPRVKLVGPSWPRRRPGDYHGYHSEGPASLADHALAPLTALPPPRWHLDSSTHLSCVSSQLAHTVPTLQASVVSSEGWFYGADPSDGGTRMDLRPGYTTTLATDSAENLTTGAHLVYEIQVDRPLTVLLYRRSWQASADALVWVDEDSDATTPPEQRTGPLCPRVPVRFQGQWAERSTQMVLREVCSGAAGWSAPGAAGVKSYLHILTVPSINGDPRATYFKSYGWATVV